MTHDARRTTYDVRSSRLHDRDLKTVRVGHRQGAVAPWELAWLVRQCAAARLDFGRQGVEVLGRVAPQPEADALGPVAALGEIVLTEHQVDGAGLELHPTQHAVGFPPLALGEAEYVAVPGDAPRQVVHGKRGRAFAQAERFRSFALGTRGSAGGLPGRAFHFLSGGHAASPGEPQAERPRCRSAR